MPNARRILEIGCGTGAVLQTINSVPPKGLFGLDIDLPALQIASTEAPDSLLTNADGHRLPFPNSAFDICFFHFVLLWLGDPVHALLEARRVTRAGGAVIAFAEPDYSQRTATDPLLAELGELQAKSLQAQGAAPNLGGQLTQLFQAAGIQPVESGQLQFDPAMMDPQSFDLELEVLKSDIAGILPTAEVDKLFSDLDETKPDLVTFQVPTFYCWGRVE